MSGDGDSALKSGRANKRLFYGEIEDDADSNHGDIDASDEYAALDPDYQLPADEIVESDSDNDREGVDDNVDRVVEPGVPELSPVKKPEKQKLGRSQVKGLSWEKYNRMLKNRGEKYESCKSKRVMPPKKIGNACKCKNKCFEKVGEEGVKCIFDSFWAIGDYNKQNEYLSSRIAVNKPKRKYTKKESSDAVRYEYSVKFHDEEFVICRNAFHAVHGISAKRCIIQQQRMRASTTGTPIADKRGQGPSANKITGPKLDCVYEHIESLPTTSSHYTRARCPHRKYLEAGGTIKLMYDKYEFWMREMHPDVEVVKLRFYEKIFTECYNIAFKLPKKDTCATCDKMKMDINDKKAKGEDVTALQTKLQGHKEHAALAQRLLSESYKNSTPPSIMSSDSTRVVAMDLQQNHPCPRISTSLAYYLRKLWVYNFCIYDVTKGKASMFVWDEVTGGRGSDEVASCLLKWVKKRQEEGEEFDVLRVFCDNSAGQNKNIFVLLTALRMIHAKLLFRVEFVFLVSGHSYMPCDRSFGNIEKKFKGNPEFLQTTGDYVHGIRTAVTPHFETFAMQQEDFFDCKALQDMVTKRKPDVGFSKASQLVVSCEYKEGYMIKTNYNLEGDDANATTHCRLMKTKKKYAPSLFDLSRVQLKQKYLTAKLIPTKKTEDLKKLRDYVNLHAKEFLDKLVAEQERLVNLGQHYEAPDDELQDVNEADDDDDYDPPVRRG